MPGFPGGGIFSTVDQADDLWIGFGEWGMGVTVRRRDGTIEVEAGDAIQESAPGLSPRAAP